MILENLLHSVNSAQSGEDYWKIQNELASALEAEELRIRRSQAAIRAFARLSNGSRRVPFKIDQITIVSKSESIATAAFAPAGAFGEQASSLAIIN
jgi:hypothetical protein